MSGINLKGMAASLWGPRQVRILWGPRQVRRQLAFMLSQAEAGEGRMGG